MGKQLGAQLGFELLDRNRQRWLRHVQALGGASKIQRFCKNHEQANATQVDGLGRTLMPCMSECHVHPQTAAHIASAREYRRPFTQKGGDGFLVVICLVRQRLKRSGHLKQGIHAGMHGFPEQTFGQAHGMRWIRGNALG